MEISAFKKNLADIAPTRMQYERATEWKSLASSINQDIIDDAFGFMPRAGLMFFSVGLMIAHNKSSLNKLKEVEKQGVNYFNAVSDLICFNIPCDLQEIDDRIDAISQITKDNGGYVWTKSEHRISRAYSFGRADAAKSTVFNDIGCFVYVYVPSLAYIVEFQICHPFAGYSLMGERDLLEIGERVSVSRIRTAHCPFQGTHVTLYKDDVYGMVKRLILKKANQIPVTEESKVSVIQAVTDIHPNGKVPLELLHILMTL